MACTSGKIVPSAEETSSAVEEISAGAQHLAERAQSAMELLDRFRVMEGAS